MIGQRIGSMRAMGTLLDERVALADIQPYPWNKEQKPVTNSQRSLSTLRMTSTPESEM